VSGIDCLFVYGTLKQGHYNYRVVEKLVGRVACGWRVRGTLFDLGRYPGLVLDGGGEVRGELLESVGMGELLRVTDEIEGDEYERVEVMAVSEDGVPRRAWTYRYLGETAGLRRLAGGEWPAGS
jgi:gamma-glutamylcyclotransferase (GGCT)/AIG2-like uncharacterized protein YtfP